MMLDSRSSPLRIAEVSGDGRSGRLGLTFCPGKKDPDAGWDRDLHVDLDVIHRWGASTVVTLIEDHEFTLLKVARLPEQVRALGMDWIHLPIRDVDVPDRRFEAAWPVVGPRLHARIDGGEGVVVHCRGGLGRAGLLAALILVERGMTPAAAMARVRAVRPGAIETQAQADYVLRWAGRHRRISAV